MALKPLPTDQSAYVGTDGKPAIVFYTWLKSLADTLNTFFVGGGTTSFAWTDLAGITVVADSGVITSYTATSRFVQFGKVVFLWLEIVITNAGTGAGPITVTFPAALPLPLQSQNAVNGFDSDFDFAVIGELLNDRTMRVRYYDNTTVVHTDADIVLSGTYEAA